MSFCRFSTDDVQSDVYVYANMMGGFTTHVAEARISQKTGRHETIGLPNDGETFTHRTQLECADFLESLREAGYLVPQSAIDRLRAEAALNHAKLKARGKNWRNWENS